MEGEYIPSTLISLSFSFLDWRWRGNSHVSAPLIRNDKTSIFIMAGYNHPSINNSKKKIYSMI